MIYFKSIIKKFNKTNSITYKNLRFPSTGIVWLKGENGSGKTTLLNILSLNDTKFDGEVFYDGDIIAKKQNSYIQNFKKTNISYLTQKNNIVDFLSASENSHIDKIVNNQKVINDKIHINSLSEGQQALIAIEKGLRPGKKIYILDEILASLDINNVSKVFNILNTLKKEALIIIVSHKNHLKEYCDICITLKKNGEAISETKENFKFDDHKIFNEIKHDKMVSFLLFIKSFKNKIKLKLSFFFMSIVLLSLLNIGSVVLSIRPDIATTNEIKSLNSFILDKNKVNCNDAMKQFNKDVYLLAHNFSLCAKPMNSSLSKITLPYQVYCLETFYDTDCHVSPNFFNYLETKHAIRFDDFFEILFSIQNNTLSKPIKLTIDKNIKHDGFFISKKFAIELIESNQLELLYFQNAYWNTKVFNAEYYNRKYNFYYLVTKKYAKQNLTVSINKELQDNTIYVNKKDLIPDGNVIFSTPRELNSNLEINRNYNYYFDNIQIKFLDYQCDENISYFLISDTFYNALKEKNSIFYKYVIFLNDQNRDYFFSYANSHYIPLSFNYEASKYSFSEDSKECLNIHNRLSSRNYIISIKYIKSNVLWVISLFYFSSLCYIVLITIYYCLIYITERKNSNIFFSYGLSEFNMRFITYCPYLFISVISIILGKIISLSLGDLSYTLGFTYYFIPLNVLFYFVIFLYQLILSIFLSKKQFYEHFNFSLSRHKIKK